MSGSLVEVSPEAPQGGGGGALDSQTTGQKGRTREDDLALLSWGKEQYDRMRQDRIPLERQWYINMAFQAGRQNIAIVKSQASTIGFQLTTPKAPPWRVRMVVNHCRRVIRTEISKLASQRPRPFVVPATTEDQDQSAARIGETILESRFATPEFGRINRSWIWWGSVIGTSFLKMYWDADKPTEDGKMKGDICIERLNPFEIFIPKMTEESIEKQPYVLHAQTLTCEEVELYYGVKVLPNASGMTDMMEDGFLNLLGAHQMQNDKALVLEYWVKPGMHKQFPEGGMFTIAGDKLVQVADKWPYRHKEYPFYKYDGIPSGRFYGDSILVDVIPLQRELNRTRSQIIENKNLMSKPRFMAYRGAINPKLITSEPGQVFMVTPGFDYPKAVDVPALPAYVTQELERISIDLDDLSGQHEITRGTNPSQVTAATALSYLQEQDDSKLYYQVASIEDATSKLGRHYLELVAEFWNTARMVRTVGVEGIVEAEEWKGSDLLGNTDVRVMAGSGLPQSKAAKQAFVIDLLKFGFLPPEKGIEMLEIGGMERIYEETLVDKRQATRENILMARLDAEQIAMERQLKSADSVLQEAQNDPEGVAQIATQFGETAEEAATEIAQTTPEPIVEVNAWDNHQLHIQYHNLFRKSQRFMLLPEEVKMEFELHVAKHQRMVYENAMREAGQQPEPMGQEGMGGPVQGDPEMPFAEQQTIPEEPQPGMDNSFTQSMNTDTLDGVPGMGTLGT